MSRWTDQFDNHAIHETLRQAHEWAHFEFEGIDSDHQTEKRRLIKVIDNINDIVDGMDPEFFPDAQLTALNNHLRHQHFWNELSKYSSNGQVQHLKTANDHLNSQSATVYQLSGMAKQPESRKAIRGVEAAYDAFCKAIEISGKSFEITAKKKAAEIKELNIKTDDLDSSLSSLKSTTETQIANWQKEFTEAQTKRIEEYSRSQIERSREYETALDEFKSQSVSDRTETTRNHDAKLQKSFDEYIEDVKNKEEEIDIKHQEILKLHGLVTNDGVAGGYKSVANSEWWAATVWSMISMLCYAVILIWVLFKGKLGFGIASTTGVDWPVVVTTVSVTGVSFVAARFAGKQSQVHRMNEQRMRWFSFEIAAINPFISTLSSEQQQKLKEQLTEKLFGQDRAIADKPSKVGDIDPKSIERLTQMFKEVIKAAKE